MIDKNHIENGFTYVELLLAVAITGLIMLALMGVVNTATQTTDTVSKHNNLIQQARFALNRMTSMTSRSTRLLLPLRDNPATNWPEHIREQTIPASAPIGDSTFSSAVLAITLPHDIDLDQDGIPDADNDEDGLIDEDLASDASNDGQPGIIGIDDNGDGTSDISSATDPDRDDDEDNDSGEDYWDGIDNDNDGSIDEDQKADNNDDGQPGISGVDDDLDLVIDEGDVKDDDEDGVINEDWYDPVVYYLSGNTLIQRHPVPWDENTSGAITGQDFITSDIAENVTRFRVERMDDGNEDEVVNLILELTDPDSGESISLQTQIRVGGAL